MVSDHGRLACFKVLATVVAAVAAACAVARPPDVAPSTAPPPALVVGEFVDDYGSRYTISAEEWFHHPAIRYRIVTWNPGRQYVIAQNAPSNLQSANLWTRIDWMPLSGMAPYEWAFCLSAYEEVSAAAAEATEIARRDQPKTGCKGFPFSRMRRLQTGPD
jgi:hypothetical protein